MKYRRYFFYGVLLIWSLSACSEEGDDENVIVSKESVRSAFDKWLEVKSSDTKYEAIGGYLRFTVNSNTSWTVRVPTWCTCTPTSGNGNGVVRVTATNNPKTVEREGQVSFLIDGVIIQTITVIQKANDIPSSGDNLPPE